MANSTSGAIKAWIEAAGLGISCYEDDPPENVTPRVLPPYVTIHPNIARVPGGASIAMDPAAGAQQIRETVQVSVWQRWKNPDGSSAESRTLVDAIENALDGSTLFKTGSGASPKHVYGVNVVSSGPRLLDRDVRDAAFVGLVHTPITLEVDRDR